MPHILRGQKMLCNLMLFRLNSKMTPESLNDYTPTVLQGKYSKSICTFHFETLKVWMSKFLWQMFDRGLAPTKMYSKLELKWHLFPLNLWKISLSYFLLIVPLVLITAQMPGDLWLLVSVKTCTWKRQKINNQPLTSQAFSITLVSHWVCLWLMKMKDRFHI